MKTKNKNSTRYFSNKQEETICKDLDAHQTSNSGAGLFTKGDCIQKEASLLIECKTCVKDKDSFSIKKDWFEKNRNEAFSQRLSNHCIAFNFGPEQPNYFVIDLKLMKFLVDKLIESNKL